MPKRGKEYPETLSFRTSKIKKSEIEMLCEKHNISKSDLLRESLNLFLIKQSNNYEKKAIRQKGG